jgi:hypothetical protein
MVNSIYNITRSLTTSDDPIYIRPMHFSQWNPSDVKPTVDIPSSDTIGIRQSPSNDSGFDSSPSSPGDLTISSSIENHQLKSSPSISSLSSVSSSSSQCRWMNCTLVFDNDTLLFDHVMKVQGVLKLLQHAGETWLIRQVLDENPRPVTQSAFLLPRSLLPEALESRRPPD